MQSRLDYAPLREALKTAAAMACIIVPAALTVWLFMAAVAA